MKVETNLKSGSALQSATAMAGQAANQVASFVSQAGQEANAVTSTILNGVTSLYHTIVG